MYIWVTMVSFLLLLLRMLCFTLAVTVTEQQYAFTNMAFRWYDCVLREYIYRYIKIHTDIILHPHFYNDYVCLHHFLRNRFRSKRCDNTIQHRVWCCIYVIAILIYSLVSKSMSLLYEMCFLFLFRCLFIFSFSFLFLLLIWNWFSEATRRKQ